MKAVEGHNPNNQLLKRAKPEPFEEKNVDKIKPNVKRIRKNQEEQAPNCLQVYLRIKPIETNSEKGKKLFTKKI